MKLPSLQSWTRLAEHGPPTSRPRSGDRITIAWRSSVGWDERSQYQRLPAEASAEYGTLVQWPRREPALVRDERREFTRYI